MQRIDQCHIYANSLSDINSWKLLDGEGACTFCQLTYSDGLQWRLAFKFIDGALLSRWPITSTAGECRHARFRSNGSDTDRTQTVCGQSVDSRRIGPSVRVRSETSAFFEVLIKYMSYVGMYRPLRMQLGILAYNNNIRIFSVLYTTCL